LPANLQGIWSESIYPPWNCDYHLDLNLQMNYWPAETAALSDCVSPLLDYLSSLIPQARKTMQEQEPGKRGWYINTAINIFGGGSHSMAPARLGWFSISGSIMPFPRMRTICVKQPIP